MTRAVLLIETHKKIRRMSYIEVNLNQVRILQLKKV